MSLKKTICTCIAVAGYFLFTAFTINCQQQLTNSVNAALDEYGRDSAWCDMNTSLPMCHQEAEISKNYNIDQAVDVYYACMG